MDKHRTLGQNGFGVTFANIIGISFIIKFAKSINLSLMIDGKVLNYCLISLCNVLHKIIPNFLVNHMWSLLVKLIDPIKSTLISKLSIHDNIMLSH